jgi:hypothetical protein
MVNGDELPLTTEAVAAHKDVATVAVSVGQAKILQAAQQVQSVHQTHAAQPPKHPLQDYSLCEVQLQYKSWAATAYCTRPTQSNQATYQHSNLVHLLHREAAVAALLAIALSLNKLLQAANLDCATIAGVHKCADQRSGRNACTSKYRTTWFN